MAITQAQADKAWQDSPSTTTPITSADLKAMSKPNRDYRWMVPTGQTSIDEFDDDTLDPAWVRVDGTGALAANATWTERGDCLSMYQLGGDATGIIRGLVRPLTGAGGATVAVGDAFITCADITGPAAAPNVFGGLILCDGFTFGAGNQVAAVGYTTNASPSGVRYQTASGTNWNLSNFNAATFDFRTGPTFMRIVRTGATTWRSDASPNGIDWTVLFTVTATITPTHVGFLSSSWGSTTVKGAVSYEFLRRVSGVS